MLNDVPVKLGKLRPPSSGDLAGISDWQFEHVLSILLPAGLLCMWLFAVTENAVNQASDTYSARLFQTCEGIVSNAKIKPVRAKKVKTEPSDA